MKGRVPLLALLLALCWETVLPLRSSAAEIDCAAYRLEPAIPLISQPALLPDGFALQSFFGPLPRPTAMVLRFNEIGQLLWARGLDGQTADLAAISSAGDGALLIAGNTRSRPGSGTFVGKLATDGSVVWSRTIQPANMNAWSINGAADGGGYIAMFGGVGDLPKTQSGLISRFSTKGGVTWTRAITFDGDPVIRPFLAAQPDGVLLANPWDVGIDRRLTILLIKLTENGTLSWARLVGNRDRDIGVSSILTLPDGSFVIAGDAPGRGMDASDTALIHLDKDGSQLPSFAFHAPPLGGLHLISRDTDGWLLLGGRFARGGRTLVDPVDPSQPVIARVGLDGEIAWAKAEDVGVKGGALFGLVRAADHLVAISTRGELGTSAFLRLTLDGEAPDSWSPAASVYFSSKRLELTTARVDVQLRSLSLEATDAGLSSSEANFGLVPLCPK